MIIDTSAFVAILNEESGFESFVEAVGSATILRVSAATLLEVYIVIDRAGSLVASRRLDEFLTEAGILVEAFTSEHARIARDAYRRFGKGSGHAAKLNYGDCFAYALAVEKREPLLFKGTDFGDTDVVSAL